MELMKDGVTCEGEYESRNKNSLYRFSYDLLIDGGSKNVVIHKTIRLNCHLMDALGVGWGIKGIVWTCYVS